MNHSARYLNDIVCKSVSEEVGIQVTQLGPSVVFNQLEHVLHELAHASLLRKKFSRYLSEEMGKHMQRRSKKWQDLNEVRTCAIQVLAWELCGLDREELEGALLKFAYGPIRELSWKGFNKMYKSELKNLKNHKKASDVVRFLNTYRVPRYDVWGRPNPLAVNAKE